MTDMGWDGRLGVGRKTRISESWGVKKRQKRSRSLLVRAATSEVHIQENGTEVCGFLTKYTG